MKFDVLGLGEYRGFFSLSSLTLDKRSGQRNSIARANGSTLFRRYSATLPRAYLLSLLFLFPAWQTKECAVLHYTRPDRGLTSSHSNAMIRTVQSRPLMAAMLLIFRKYVGIDIAPSVNNIVRYFKAKLLRLAVFRTVIFTLQILRRRVLRRGSLMASQ